MATISSHYFHENLPLHFAKYLVVLAELLVLSYLVATEDLTPSLFLVIGVVGLVTIFLVTLANWPLGAVFVLAAGSAMPKFMGSLFGLHVRPEHISIAFVAGVILWLAMRGRISVVHHLRSFDYFLIAYIFLNFFTSAFTSPEPRMTLRWATMNAIIMLPYFLLRVLVTSETVFRKAFDILLWVGAAESVYAIICFLSNRLFTTKFGMEIGQYGAIPGTYGTQYEPNLLGSYAACCAVMFLTMFFLGDRSRWHGLGCVVCLLAAAISLARSAIVAFPLVAMVVVWVAFRRGTFQIRKMLPMLAAAGVLLLIFSPFLLSMLRERFSTIDLTEISSDETTAGRLIQMAAAVNNVQQHPWLGTGTASFQLLFNWQGVLGEDSAGWVSNTPLRILHDTGVIGFAVFSLFVGLLIKATRKLFRLLSPKTKSVFIALEMGLLLYAITFQSSEASLLAFTWVHLGLLAAGLTVAQTEHAATLSR
ncbi:MAG TPA: O-antigen ligase family protein [Terriglobales bacterium]|jgi:oligosaccharide repeat unit polymerase|nr:O-antigen ligase family protein [Terriglobales bacterium]